MGISFLERFLSNRLEWEGARTCGTNGKVTKGRPVVVGGDGIIVGGNFENS